MTGSIPQIAARRRTEQAQRRPALPALSAQRSGEFLFVRPEGARDGRSGRARPTEGPHVP